MGIDGVQTARTARGSPMRSDHSVVNATTFKPQPWGDGQGWVTVWRTRMVTAVNHGGSSVLHHGDDNDDGNLLEIPSTTTAASPAGECARQGAGQGAT